MTNQNTKSIVIKNLVWKIMENCGIQGIQFIVQIVLARLLLPEDYGLISLVTIFIAIANVFVQSGFNTALIQKKDSDEIDFSSVFYLSLTVAVIAYIGIFCGAPIVANFYGESELVLILRVLGVTLFFGAFNSIQNAVIAKNMQFKKLFFSSLGASLVSGIVGVILAYNGLGVWALVSQQIFSQVFITIILWFTVKWRPTLVFSIKRVGVLFNYGSKLLVSSLVDTIYMNLRNLVIGKVYTPEMLGMYNRGQQFPQLIVNNINGSIQSVMLPTLSLEQDNKIRIKTIVRRSIVTSSFIIFPAMIGLAAIAEPVVRIILTDKWIPCVPFLQVFCFTYALMPIHTANLQAINAIGRSDIFLKLEVYKKVIGVIILIITIPYGVYAIALGGLIGSLISSFINSYPNLKLINYSYKEQLKDIIPSLSIAMIMGVIVYSVTLFNIPMVLTLSIQVLFGVASYIGMAYLFKLECFYYLLNTIKNIIGKK
ncbi:lipopolysaccharide biosynthesis protein [Paraclostridium bifermentans]|uniref:lipopolysaccharide biosynthesis protein n=1 Tax=Paraclostridium bifermentans TaxID=1490 RepID=UPI00374E9A2E